jgi:hypothetical protein
VELPELGLAGRGDAGTGVEHVERERAVAHGSPWVRLRRADITRVDRSVAAGDRAGIRVSAYSVAPGTLIAMALTAGIQII